MARPGKIASQGAFSAYIGAPPESIRPQNSDNCQGEDEEGKGQQDVHKPLYPQISFAAEIGAEHPYDRPASGPKKRRDKANKQGNTRAIDDAGEHVAAKLIRAQPVGQT